MFMAHIYQALNQLIPFESKGVECLGLLRKRWTQVSSTVSLGSCFMHSSISPPPPLCGDALQVPEDVLIWLSSSGAPGMWVKEIRDRVWATRSGSRLRGTGLRASASGGACVKSEEGRGGPKHAKQLRGSTVTGVGGGGGKGQCPDLQQTTDPRDGLCGERWRAAGSQLWLAPVSPCREVEGNRCQWLRVVEWRELGLLIPPPPRGTYSPMPEAYQATVSAVRM